jgi:hypothetical protein
MANDVQVLRDFRDRRLLTNALGRAFVRSYYQCSPPVAFYISRHETLRAATRAVLTPVVFSIRHPAAALIVVVFAGFVGFAVRRKAKSAPERRTELQRGRTNG